MKRDSKNTVLYSYPICIAGIARSV